MASTLGGRLGIESNEEEPIVEPVIPTSTEPVVTPTLSEEDADRITLERINKARGTNFTSLDEAFTAISNTPPAPAPVAETEEEKKRKRQNEVVKYAIDNNIVSAQEFEDFHKDSAKDAREIVWANFYDKHHADGKSDQWIEKTFKKYYGEDIELEDENDDVAPWVKAEQQERLKKDAAKIIRNKFPKIQTLDKDYDAHLSKLNKDSVENERLKKNAQTYIGDVESYFTNFQPIKLKVGGEAGKPETDFTTDFTPTKEILDAIKAEVLAENTLLSFIGKYNKEALYKYINLRVMEDTEEQRIGHVAKKYHDHQKDKSLMKKKGLEDDNLITPGTGGSQNRSVLGQKLGISEAV